MDTITNDSELRTAIQGLSLDQQRTLAGQFVLSVINLTGNPRLKRAAEMVANPDRSNEELADMFRTVKAIAVDTYAACGSDADWLAQAEHFVAAACAAALAPEDQLRGSSNPAWKAAMQVRTAKNCEMIESGEGSVSNEAQRQYEIAARFGG